MQQAHNLTLPAWAKEILDSDESNKFLSFAFSLVVKTEEMKRLRGGPLLREILSNMKRLVSRHSQANRVIMFSGHDITLARILDTLSIFEPPHIPDFNSVLLLELHRRASRQSTEEKDYFVQVVKLAGIFNASSCLIWLLLNLIDFLGLLQEWRPRDCSDETKRLR